MNENKKSSEELADEELDAVTGGNGRQSQGAMCPKCQRHILLGQAERRDGHYYCPYCPAIELPSLEYQKVSQ